MKLNNDEVDKKKKTWGKRKELGFRRESWLIHYFQNISPQKIYTFWNCVVNEKVPSTSSQIIDQIEIIQRVVLSGISKLNDSVPQKPPKTKQHFLQKKILEKGKWIWHCLLYLLSR